MCEFCPWGESVRDSSYSAYNELIAHFTYPNVVFRFPITMQEMKAKHPFLDAAYLWFSPRNFFFVGSIPDSKLSLRWDRLPRIRRIAPSTRVIDPDCSIPPKKVHVNPVHLPGMRTIVRTLCPNMLHLKPAVPVAPVPVANRGGGSYGGNEGASTSRVRVEDLRGPLPTEEIVTEDGDKFDWDWWGSMFDPTR